MQYSPIIVNVPAIGLPMLTEHPRMKEVAKKLEATEAQVLVAWGAYREYSFVPKSIHEGIREARLFPTLPFRFIRSIDTPSRFKIASSRTSNR